tara:strand:- start:6823 stop:8073 length:1251 start_codon:yes stop_codon:yes gene_type:complete
MDKIKNIKGTKDIFGDDSYIWQYVEYAIHNFIQKYGYTEIRTPKFENSALFKRTIGNDTDIVSKEMYSWTDQGNNSLTLKPEVTASVVRAYIQHNLGKKNITNKLYYIDSLFRRERPQKGRYRQFEQFGIEAIGSKYPEQDSEVISLAYNFYKNLNIKNLSLKINNIGSRETRLKYKKELLNYLKPFSNKLTKTSQNRLKTNPLRILDTKIDFEIDIIKNCPKIIDFISKKDLDNFNKVLDFLQKSNIKYEIDHLLVRGLDYYSRTVFEIHTDVLGAQSALCGGGRYDYLIEELGGSPTPAVGFAAGIERLILALKLDHNKIIKRPDIYMITAGSQAVKFSIPIANDLRLKTGKIVINDMHRRSLKSQLKEANKFNAKYVIIIGSDEIEKGEVLIKDMKSGEQKNIEVKKIDAFFK